MNLLNVSKNLSLMKNRLHTLCLACFILTTVSCLLSETSYSQSLIIGNDKTRFEAGLNIGPSFFLGDLGGHKGKGTTFIKDVNLPITQLMVGAFITYYPNQWLGFRAALNYGKLEGEDQLITTKGENELYRKQRNLDFRTNLAEGYIATEIYPLAWLNRNNEDYKPRFSPYGVLGVGVFHFNPQGSLTDSSGKTTWYYLRPLHTEGEGFPEYPDRKEYALTQVNIPIGFGVKYYVSDRVNLSLEVLYRHTFTDYIDDVSTTYIDPSLFYKYLSPQNAAIAVQISDKEYSPVSPGLSRLAPNPPGTQRGDPNQNDAYFTTFVKFAIRLGPVYKSRYDENVASRMRCPHRF